MKKNKVSNKILASIIAGSKTVNKIETFELRGTEKKLHNELLKSIKTSQKVKDTDKTELIIARHFYNNRKTLMKNANKSSMYAYNELLYKTNTKANMSKELNYYMTNVKMIIQDKGMSVKQAMEYIEKTQRYTPLEDRLNKNIAKLDINPIATQKTDKLGRVIYYDNNGKRISKSVAQKSLSNVDTKFTGFEVIGNRNYTVYTSRWVDESGTVHATQTLIGDTKHKLIRRLS